jgi:hypothetical protein
MAGRAPREPGAARGATGEAPSRGRRWIGWLAFAVVLIAAAGALIVGLVSFDSRVGYFGPAFSADGSAVVVVERRTRGIVWGLGWESFTPPTNVRVMADELRLLRIPLYGGAATVLESWSTTPVVGRTLQQYRGRLFNQLGASLRTQPDGAIEYGFEFALPRIPTAELHQLHGVWSSDAARRRRGAWDGAAHAVVGLSEPVIHGELELFALRGPEAFPSAIALLEHASRQIRIVIAAPAFASTYPHGPSRDELMQVSRKADHDRVQAMTRIQREREALYQSQGALPGEATLKAYRDLRDLGYFGKPPRWVARRLTAVEVTATSTTPRFDVDEMEFKVGLMHDIAQAIARSGVEVDRDVGRYITHRDFPNAGRLNAVLEKGATEVVIGYRGDAYLLTLLPRTEAEKKR